MKRAPIRRGKNESDIHTVSLLTASVLSSTLLGFSVRFVYEKPRKTESPIFCPILRAFARSRKSYSKL